MFGIPLEFDTGSAESDHKVTKTAAKTTQRNQETFDLQTANHLLEYRVVDMAMEVLNGRPLWNCFDGFSHRVVPEKPQVTLGDRPLKSPAFLVPADIASALLPG